jgi:hypothetical protein
MQLVGYFYHESRHRHCYGCVNLHYMLIYLYLLEEKLRCVHTAGKHFD